jgi:hypothetical protein
MDLTSKTLAFKSVLASRLMTGMGVDMVVDCEAGSLSLLAASLASDDPPPPGHA